MKKLIKRIIEVVKRKLKKMKGKFKREFLGIPFENFRRMFPVPQSNDRRSIEDKIMNAEVIGKCEDCKGDTVYSKKSDLLYCKNCGRIY